MIIRQEQAYKINNLESFVHCLHQWRPAISAQTAPEHIYHYHAYIELLYFPEGEGAVWINGTKNPFYPGTFIIVNSQKPHCVWFYKPGTIICIKFLPQVLYENEQSFLYFKYVLPFVSANKNGYVFPEAQIRNTPIVDLVRQIIYEWNTKGIAYELVIRANIQNIFTHVFRIWEATQTPFHNKSLNPEIARCLSYITANYQTVTETQVAKICGLSPNYFSALFKQQMNMGFREYLVNIKLTESEKLLLTTAKSITAIAGEVGFSTTSHYISLFRKKRGVTPASFRRCALKR